MLLSNVTGAIISTATVLNNTATVSLPSDSLPAIQSLNTERKIDENQIQLPWKKGSTDLLEWWIIIQYDGKEFEKKVPVSITDFRDRFLKHPEYGERLRFDVDEDLDDDVEVKVGIYWADIINSEGKDIKSLEQRCRVRLLNEGSYLSDEYASFEVWSELHVNYGLIKKSFSSIDSIDAPILQSIYTMFNYYFPSSKVLPFLDSLIDHYITLPTNNPVDSDNFQMGIGFRSAEGEKTPLDVDKRFAFARDSLFSPTIFQHIMDPSASSERSRLEMLYGLRSYKAGQNSPTFDIDFSICFDPAVYLKTKFIPREGFVYYYFNEKSQRPDTTGISFISEIEEGSGESISLTLLFDALKESLAQEGRWMSFDIDLLGDSDLLAGSFHYAASHSFDINFTIDSPYFEEKMQLSDIPTLIDVFWDLDFDFSLPPQLFASANGFIDVSMNDDLGSLRLFYPSNTSLFSGNTVFIDLPQGLPRSNRLEASVSLSLDLFNIQNAANYVSGRLLHQSSQNIAVIDAYLPELDDFPVGPFDTPILHVTEIPTKGEVNGKLYWNNLQGYAQVLRNSSGPPDPVDITLSYGNLSLFNHLEIRQGYIDTRFQLAENGYFHFDTSDNVIGNMLTVSNTDTGNSIGLSVDEIAANSFRADWDLDTSGSRLGIPRLSFSGMLDRLKDLQLAIDYQGKHTDLTLDWTLRQIGSFMIGIDQDTPLTLDFDQFAPDSETFSLGGGITISEDIAFDMNWNLQQGEKQGEINDPGHFTVNEYNDQTNLDNFDFHLIYQNQYGVNISLDNVKFYLDFEWWKGNRLFPYTWLDYEISSDEFNIDLLWTNGEGNTQWYDSVEEW